MRNRSASFLFPRCPELWGTLSPPLSHVQALNPKTLAPGAVPEHPSLSLKETQTNPGHMMTGLSFGVVKIGIDVLSNLAYSLLFANLCYLSRVGRDSVKTNPFSGGLQGTTLLLAVTVAEASAPSERGDFHTEHCLPSRHIDSPSSRLPRHVL